MRLKTVAPLLIIGAAAATLAAACEASARYEEPGYTTLFKDGQLEIRRYPAVVAASVAVAGTTESSANNAFRILAGYIFGKNRKKTRIAMTVPVIEQMPQQKIAMTVPVTSKATGDTMIMSFYMPSKFSIDDLPEPLDSRIKFENIPAKKYAVVRFSGWCSPSNMEKHEDILLDFIKREGLTTAGEPVRAFYNPPWTLPFLRRNEIWIEIT